MQVERSITNNIVLQKQREREYQLHQQKIKEIQSKSSLPRQKQTENEMVKQIHQSKVQATFFQQSERLRQIKKENKQLLDNLITIGDGKKSQFRSIWGLVESTDHSKLMADTTIYRSQSQSKRLHSPHRRRELQRIEEENHQMAQRIIAQPSTLSTKVLIKHGQQYTQLRDQIKKVKPKNNVRLPPMDKTRTNEHNHSQEKPSQLYGEETIEKIIQQKTEKLQKQKSMENPTDSGYVPLIEIKQPVDDPVEAKQISETDTDVLVKQGSVTERQPTTTTDKEPPLEKPHTTERQSSQQPPLDEVQQDPEDPVKEQSPPQQEQPTKEELPQEQPAEQQQIAKDQ